MKYEKPQLLLQTAALTTIQNPSDKSEIDTFDNTPHVCSLNAYAADE
jgi:hypothetical protein